jgi:hypothetical protein
VLPPAIDASRSEASPTSMAAPLRPIACLAAGLSLACSSDQGAPEVPASLVIVAGNAQVDTIGATLADSLAVRVTGASGNGIAMVGVKWNTFDGVVHPESTTTDPSGVAKAQWTLRSDPGQAHLTVSLLDSTSTLSNTFAASVNPGRPVRLRLTPYGSSLITVGTALPIAAIVRDRLDHVLVSASIQWSSSDAGVATVSDSAASTPDISGFGVVHPVGSGRAFIGALSGGVQDSTAIVVARDTAVFGSYDLRQRDNVAFPYCEYPIPVEVHCFSGSLTIDGIGGFVAKRYYFVTFTVINLTTLDSSVTTGSYQATSPCQLTLASSAEPQGDGLKNLDSLVVTSDPAAPEQHRWVYRGSSRPGACP